MRRSAFRSSTGQTTSSYDAVMTAIRILSEPCGMAIAAKAITLSTVGIIPGIRRITDERHRARLVVSLTFADPLQRRELLPVEQGHPTPDLIQALREKLGMPVARRYSGGQDIHGACGMLAGGRA